MCVLVGVESGECAWCGDLVNVCQIGKDAREDVLIAAEMQPSASSLPSGVSLSVPPMDTSPPSSAQGPVSMSDALPVTAASSSQAAAAPSPPESTNCLVSVTTQAASSVAPAIPTFKCSECRANVNETPQSCMCGAAHYCNKECQKKGWVKGHSAVCPANVASSAASSVASAAPEAPALPLAKIFSDLWDKLPNGRLPVTDAPKNIRSASLVELCDLLKIDPGTVHLVCLLSCVHVCVFFPSASHGCGHIAVLLVGWFRLLTQKRN